MAYLVLGLVLFLGVHSVSIVAPAWRDRIAVRLGNAWRCLYSLLSIAGFVAIIWGYDIARRNPVVLYTPWASARYLTAVLMIPVFPLVLAAYFPGHIKRALQHPMLAGIMLWSLAHLLSTGTLANVMLFGGFLAWAIADRFSYRWRAQRPIQTAPAMRLNDVIVVAVGLAFYIAFTHWLHARWFGVQPLPI